MFSRFVYTPTKNFSTNKIFYPQHIKRTQLKCGDVIFQNKNFYLINKTEIRSNGGSDFGDKWKIYLAFNINKNKINYNNYISILQGYSCFVENENYCVVQRNVTPDNINVNEYDLYMID